MTEKVVLREALRLFDIALATDQLSTFERAQTYNNRCWILLILHMLTDLALADCERAVDLDPEIAEVCVNQARALMKQGLFDEAKANILRPLQLVPDSRTTLINLGALQMRMDNFEAAMKAFDRAFALNPQSAAAYNDRGSLYLQTGDYKMALRDFDMAIAMENDFALAMFNRGIVFLRQGNSSGGPPGLFESRSLRPPRRPCVFISRVCRRCLGRARSRAQGL
ncbi:MAG: tetratricopeptide repeat protein [Pseudomonadota bacterium]|nr:tetratricopeptide repeat protein [Pseudomonadota bacterium]